MNILSKPLRSKMIQDAYRSAIRMSSSSAYCASGSSSTAGGTSIGGNHQLIATYEKLVNEMIAKQQLQSTLATAQNNLEKAQLALDALRLGGLIQRLEDTVLPDDYGIDKEMERADKWGKTYYHLPANMKETLNKADAIAGHNADAKKAEIFGETVDGLYHLRNHFANNFTLGKPCGLPFSFSPTEMVVAQVICELANHMLLGLRVN